METGQTKCKCGSFVATPSLCTTCNLEFHPSCLKKHKCINPSPTAPTIVGADANLVEKLLVENELLRKLITEMTDKNSLLKEHVDLLKNKITDLTQTLDKAAKDNETVNNNSYARAVKKPEPVVLITPIASQSAEDTARHIRNTISATGFNLGGIKHGNNGNIIIKYRDENTKIKLKEVASKQLGGAYNVGEYKYKYPKIKIVNLKDKLTKEEVHECLIKQNACINENSALKVLHIAENSRGNFPTFTVYIETNGSTFESILKGGHLNVGWDRCKVYEDLKLLRCFNCYGHNHKSDRCTKKEPTCGKCADRHNTKDCTSPDVNCTNCLSARESLNVENIDSKHESWSRECPYYLRLLKRHQSMVNYNAE